MTRKLVKWASNDGQIIKSRLSDGRRAKFLPSVVVFVYGRLRIEGHLGNVGLRMAQNSQELGHSTSAGKQEPESEERPFYVLLQDDKLITHVAVTSDMLLEPVEKVSPDESVRLVINVTVRPYNTTLDNMEFG